MTITLRILGVPVASLTVEDVEEEDSALETAVEFTDQMLAAARSPLWRWLRR